MLIATFDMTCSRRLDLSSKMAEMAEFPNNFALLTDDEIAELLDAADAKNTKKNKYDMLYADWSHSQGVLVWI